MFLKKNFFLVSITAVIFIQCNVSTALPEFVDKGQDYTLPNQAWKDDESKYPTSEEEEDDEFENEKLYSPPGQQSSSFDPSSIPDFNEIMDTLNELPPDIVNEIKEFLENIVPRMPHGNPVTAHLSNGLFMLNLYENFVSGNEIMGIDPELQDELQNTLSNAATEVEDLKYFVSAAATHSDGHSITKKALDKTSEKVGQTPEVLTNIFKEQPSIKIPKESKLKQSHVVSAAITSV